MDIHTSAEADFAQNGAENHAPGNLSVSIRGKSGEAFLRRLDLKGIAVSTASAFDSRAVQNSRVLKAISLPAEYACGTVRVTLGAGNGMMDWRAIAKAVVDILGKS